MSAVGLQKGVFYKHSGVKLASYLESLGPIFTKFGQLLSTRTDILDAKTAKDLETLTDNCKPFRVDILKKIVVSDCRINKNASRSSIPQKYSLKDWV